MQEFITANIDFAPILVFIALVFAGLNVPVSEDLMIFLSAMMAQEYPERLPYFFLGVYLGAYVSDVICYSLGRFVGPKLLRIAWFAKMVTPKRLERINHYYRKYGGLTLIIGRFIPFGVRNGLFLAAGLGKMSFKKFLTFDFVACTITVSLYFYLYYHFGEIMLSWVKKGNYILFGLTILAVSYFFILRKKSKKS